MSTHKHWTRPRWSQCQIFLEQLDRAIPVVSLAGELQYGFITTRVFVLWKRDLYGPKLTLRTDLSHLAQVQDITHIVWSGQLTHSEASKIGQRVHGWVQGYVVSSILNYVQVRDECHQQRQSDGTAFIDARRFLMKSNHDFGNQKWLSWIRAVMHFVNEPDCRKVRLDSSWLQSQISQVRHI